MINPSADAVNILRIEIEDIEPLIWWRVACALNESQGPPQGHSGRFMGWLEFTANVRHQ
jgi:hypothetical protein